MTRARVAILAVSAVLLIVGVASCGVKEKEEAVTQTGQDEKPAPTAVAQAPGGPGGDRAEGGRGAEGAEAFRERLTAAGATEADTKAIEAHRTKQREIMASLREAMGALREAGGEGGTNEQARKAISQYEGLMKTGLPELAKAEQALTAKLKLSERPKLHAALLSAGVLDNGMRGMRGGRPGGPGGGRGEGREGPSGGGGERPGGGEGPRGGGGAPREGRGA